MDTSPSILDVYKSSVYASATNSCCINVYLEYLRISFASTIFKKCLQLKMLTKIMKNYYEKKLTDPINDIKIYFGVIFNKS